MRLKLAPQLAPLPAIDHAPETERTVSSGRLCAGCGVALINRRPQARFCSGPCRARHHRSQHDEALKAALQRILTAVIDAVALLDGAP